MENNNIIGTSVTKRIGEINQPYGGYLKLSQFTKIKLNDGKTLNLEENVHPTVMGMVVDYLTRYEMTKDKNKAFEISMNGSICASIISKNKNDCNDTQKYLENINDIDDISIENACKLVTFDVWLRDIMKVYSVKKGDKDINPDKRTINNIQIMVNRCVNFWKKYGPIVDKGFTFEKGGYTQVVNSGNGDYITKDTMWNFKVSKHEPKSKNILQLLMYYIMGKHSEKDEFKGINKIGFYNPRLNIIYILNTNEIDPLIIRDVEEKVICYDESELTEVKIETQEEKLAKMRELIDKTRNFSKN